LTNLGNFLSEELKSSIGYPQSDKLLCPVFLQDKFMYLEACREICNPSLKLERTVSGILNSYKRKLFFDKRSKASNNDAWI